MKPSAGLNSAFLMTEACSWNDTTFAVVKWKREDPFFTQHLLCTAYLTILSGHSHPLVESFNSSVIQIGKKSFYQFNLRKNFILKFSFALFFAFRILILDWDVHHGQGVQQMFYEDPRFLSYNTHVFKN